MRWRGVAVAFAAQVPIHAGVNFPNPKPVTTSVADWNAPWLAHLRELGEAVAQQVRLGTPQSEALNMVAQTVWILPEKSPIRFVAQAELPPVVSYEQFIYENAQCPTREGLHDFFNGLAWLHFPQTKHRLNQLHATQIANAGIAPVRGPARDALTLFDENAALMRAPDDLWDALVAKDWSRVFGDLRKLWSQTYLLLFGHALLEKLVSPRKSITAHVYRAYPVADSVAAMDEWTSTELTAMKLSGKPFAHLPVLGVPGWWPANQNPDFYDDANVFRPPRLTP
jgi:hypothetical protein